MRCIKTGFDGYCESRGLYLHGDAFVLVAEGTVASLAKGAGYADEPVHNPHHWLLLRVSDESPIDSTMLPIHLRFSQPTHWFDRGSRYSTLLVAPHEWAWLGYTGQTLAHL